MIAMSTNWDEVHRLVCAIFFPVSPRSFPKKENINSQVGPTCTGEKGGVSVTVKGEATEKTVKAEATATAAVPVKEHAGAKPAGAKIDKCFSAKELFCGSGVPEAEGHEACTAAKGEKIKIPKEDMAHLEGTTTWFSLVSSLCVCIVRNTLSVCVLCLPSIECVQGEGLAHSLKVRCL